jgi:hypothetical protein
MGEEDGLEMYVDGNEESETNATNATSGRQIDTATATVTYIIPADTCDDDHQTASKIARTGHPELNQSIPTPSVDCRSSYVAT